MSFKAGDMADKQTSTEHINYEISLGSIPYEPLYVSFPLSHNTCESLDDRIRRIVREEIRREMRREL